MLLVSQLKENTAECISRLNKKNFKDAEYMVSAIIDLDDARKKIQTLLDLNLAEQNTLAGKIGELFKQGKKEDADTLKLQTSELKEKSKVLALELEDAEKALYDKLVLLPNLPHSSVPSGKTPQENEVVFEHGTIPTLHSKATPHWELTTKYDLIDFELGVKLTGAGFPE